MSSRVEERPRAAELVHNARAAQHSFFRALLHDALSDTHILQYRKLLSTQLALNLKNEFPENEESGSDCRMKLKCWKTNYDIVTKDFFSISLAEQLGFENQYVKLEHIHLLWWYRSPCYSSVSSLSIYYKNQSGIISTVNPTVFTRCPDDRCVAGSTIVLVFDTHSCIYTRADVVDIPPTENIIDSDTDSFTDSDSDNEPEAAIKTDSFKETIEFSDFKQEKQFQNDSDTAIPDDVLFSMALRENVADFVNSRRLDRIQREYLREMIEFSITIDAGKLSKKFDILDHLTLDSRTEQRNNLQMVSDAFWHGFPIDSERYSDPRHPNRVRHQAVMRYYDQFLKFEPYIDHKERFGLTQDISRSWFRSIRCKCVKREKIKRCVW